MKNEGESPRGRISLISAYARGDIAISDIREHIESCLLCTACEGVCPSNVAYYDLLTQTKNELFLAQPALKRGFVSMLSNAIAALAQKAWLRRFIIAYSNVSLRPFIRMLLTSRLARLEAFLPELSTEKKLVTRGGSGKKVGLLTGCVGRLVDQDLLSLLQDFLQTQGYQVVFPKDVGCCGALHYHSGEQAKGLALLTRNKQLFAKESVDWMVSVASGCGAFIAKHSEGDKSVRDVSDFLYQQIACQSLNYLPLDARVAIHTPCSLKQSYGDSQAVFQLLRNIPQIEVIELPENGQCCGAAGAYMISQPIMADRLVEDKISALKACGASILLTSNVGCSLHIRAAIEREGLDIKVMHPVALLLQHLVCEVT